jgi:hypothetical protein
VSGSPARRGTRQGYACALALALLALAAAPRGAHAQCFSTPLDPECKIDVPTWVGEFATMSANAVLGGVTAGLRRQWQGGDFSDAFVRGALGGALGYGGKRLAIERFDGAGFLGRQVAAVGSSFVRNAAEGVPLLDRLNLPAYLVRLEIRPRAATGPRVQPRLDVATAIWTSYSIIEDDLHFEPGKSLSAGALVFETDGKIFGEQGDTTNAIGRAEVGVVFLAGVPQFGEAQLAEAFAHERVHTIQFDQAYEYWTDPLEAAATRFLGAQRFGRYIDLNASTELIRLFGSGLEYADRPWELEARWLAR